MEASVTQLMRRGLLPRDGVCRACGPVAEVAAVSAVGAQIAYPLLSGTALIGVTVLTVALFATAVVAHTAAAWGAGAATRLVVVAGGFALAVEAVGLRTGIPFGRYAYGSALGPAVLGVPLVVLGAWTMMALPCLVLGRRLAAARPATGRSAIGRSAIGRRVTVAVLGGLALAAWDLFLDPQLVAAGLWTWTFPEPGLPGVPTVPLTNLAGWVLAGTLLTALLDAVIPPAGSARRSARPVPAALLAWTWLGSTVANLAFFARPALAGYGAVALGATVVPYLLLTARDLRAARPGPAR